MPNCVKIAMIWARCSVGVVDRLGEKDRLWHITRGPLPVDLHRVAGLHLRRPLNQPRAACTHRIRHLRDGQWRRSFWTTIRLTGADPQKVRSFSRDNVLQCVSDGAKSTDDGGIQLFVGQPGASFEDAHIGPAVVAKQRCECVGRVHVSPYASRSANVTPSRRTIGCHRDDQIAHFPSGLGIPVSLGHLLQRIAPIDDWA